MPKFYKQNKKRLNPRYFLNEKIEIETKVSEGFLSKTFKKTEKNNMEKYITSGDSILDYLQNNRDDVTHVKYHLGVFLKTLGSKSHSSKFEDYTVKGFFQDGVVKSDALKKLIYDFRDSDYNAKELRMLYNKIENMIWFKRVVVTTKS